MMTKIGKYLESCPGQGVFPGASWLIGNCEGFLEKGSVGVLGNGLGPVEEDSIYDMASLTKIFVSLALMKQFEDGLVRLDDTSEYFLPSFKDSPLAAVTIFELMTHTAPIPGGINRYRYAKSREELLESIRSGPTRSDGGEKVIYTCEAYMLLGEIVSAIDSAGLDEVVRRRVIDALGMKITGYKPAPGLFPRIAPTEDCPWRGKVVRGQVHDENAVIMGEVSGNAGIFSCAEDMALIGKAMLASLEKSDFLKKASAELMTRNHTAGKGENRGLGWMLKTPGNSAGDLLSAESFGHTGFTGTSLWIDPKRKFYAILLTNRVHPKRNNTKLFRSRHIFHNLAVLEYGADQ